MPTPGEFAKNRSDKELYKKNKSTRERDQSYVSKTTIKIARSSREIKLLVSTVGPSSHEFTSHFGLAIFCIAENSKTTISETESPECVQLNEPATGQRKKNSNEFRRGHYLVW